MVSRMPDYRSLSQLFAAKEIPTDSVAFYNHTNFKAEEARDPAFFELYGAWVRQRPRTAEYDSKVLRVVRTIADAFSVEVTREPRKGLCSDSSMALIKMLEEQGIWCYGVRSAVVIRHDSSGLQEHFPLFVDEESEQVAAHVWVAAPPIELIDITIGNQLLKPAIQKLDIPNFIVEEKPKLFDPKPADYLMSGFRKQLEAGVGVDAYLRQNISPLVTELPSYKVVCGQIQIRYAVGGMVMSEAPTLDDIVDQTWNGRFAGALYREVILPALASA